MNMYIRKRLPVFTFVIILFVLGIGFGAVAVKTVEYNVREGVFNYFNGFMEGYNNLEYNQTALIGESIKFNLLNILIIWVFGLSVVLMPLVSVLIFFKGFVLGFTIGFLVSEYSWKGITIALAAVFPQNLIIIPVYIMSAVIAIYISIQIFKHYRGYIRVNFEDILTYSLEMTLLAAVLLLGSLMETYISPFLLKIILRFI
ncbi:MAG: stage II sporulation protein M [Halanaerobiaceae bacterium]